MVNLGFIKNARQCPPGSPRVFVRHGPSGPAPTIRAWRERRGHSVELRWDVPDGRDLVRWPRDMAFAMADLRWHGWWLDAQSVAAVTGLPLSEGLTAWGMEFWGHYRKSGRVFIQIGEDGRAAVEKSVEAWVDAFPHVSFDARLDIDLQVRQKAEELRDKPIRRTLARLFPALFNSL